MLVINFVGVNQKMKFSSHAILYFLPQMPQTLARPLYRPRDSSIMVTNDTNDYSLNVYIQ